MLVGGNGQSRALHDVDQTEGRNDLLLYLVVILQDGPGQYALLLCGRTDDAASFGNEMYIGKQFPEANGRRGEERSHLPLHLTLDDAKQILIIALPLEKLKNLNDSLIQLAGKFHLSLFLGHIAVVLGNDRDEFVLLLVQLFGT
jgi:hypothetical protein